MSAKEKAKTYKKTRTLRRLNAAEDKTMLELYYQYGEPECYQKMKEKLNLKSIRTAKEHCQKYLLQDAKRPFTEEEDQLILEKVKIFGHRWTQISEYFTDKSDINIRNRYKQLIREQSGTPKKRRVQRKYTSKCLKSPLSTELSTPDMSDIDINILDVEPLKDFSFIEQVDFERNIFTEDSSFW